MCWASVKLQVCWLRGECKYISNFFKKDSSIKFVFICRLSLFLHLTIAPKLVFDDLKSGDSVAINGVCLTVTAFSSDDFDVSVVQQTQRVTNLSELKQGDDVNLERAMKLHSRVGGHCVQGHRSEE